MGTLDKDTDELLDELEKELDDEMDESYEEYNKRMDEYYKWWKEEEKKETDECKENERKKLLLEIQNYRKTVRKNKFSRALWIIVVYSLKNMFIFYNIINIFDDNELKFVVLILMPIPSIIMAIIGYYINIFIFEDIITSNKNDEGLLEMKIERFRKLDKQINDKREI